MRPGGELVGITIIRVGRLPDEHGAMTVTLPETIPAAVLAPRSPAPRPEWITTARAQAAVGSGPGNEWATEGAARCRRLRSYVDSCSAAFAGTLARLRPAAERADCHGKEGVAVRVRRRAPEAQSQTQQPRWEPVPPGVDTGIKPVGRRSCTVDRARCPAKEDDEMDDAVIPGHLEPSFWRETLAPYAIPDPWRAAADVATSGFRISC